MNSDLREALEALVLEWDARARVANGDQTESGSTFTSGVQCGRDQAYTRAGNELYRLLQADSDVVDL